jgi:hypothetical protein
MLNYSKYLLEPDLDRLFTALLIELQKHKTKLRLQEAIYSGILVLTVHANSEVRELGYAYLHTASTLISEKEESHIVPIIKAVFDHIRSLTDGVQIPKTFHFCNDLSVLWRGIYLMTKYTSKVTIPSFFTKAVHDADRLLLHSFEKSNAAEFWSKCQLLEVLLKYTDCRWISNEFSGSFASQTCLGILKDDDFSNLLLLAEGEYHENELVHQMNLVMSILLLLVQLSQSSDWLAPSIHWILVNYHKWNQTSVRSFTKMMEQLVGMRNLNEKVFSLILPFLLTQGVSFTDLGIILQLLINDLKKVQAFASDLSASKLEKINVDLWRKAHTYEFNKQQVAKFLEAGSVLCFLGHVDKPNMESFDVNWRIMSNQIMKIFEGNFRSIEMKWEMHFRYFIFNDKGIQRVAEEKLLFDTESDAISSGVEYYLLRYKSNYTDAMYGYLKEYKSLVMNGFKPIYSASRILDWFTNCQIMYSTSSLKDLYQNFWIRGSIFCTSLCSETSNWWKSNRLEFSDVKRLFVKAVRVLRSFVKYKSLSMRVSGEDALHLHWEWLEDTIRALAPWIDLKQEESSRVAFDLILLMLKEEKSMGNLNADLLSDMLMNKKVLDREQERQLKRAVWESNEKMRRNKDSSAEFKRSGSPELSSTKQVKIPKIEIPTSNFHRSENVTKPSFNNFEELNHHQKITVKPNVPSSRLIHSIAKKSTVQTKKMSTFDRLKTETYLDSKKANLQVPIPKPVVSTIRRLEADELPEQPVRERRSVQEIQLHNLRPSHGVPIAVPTNDHLKQTKELLNLESLFDRILNWKLNDDDHNVSDLRPPQPIPDRFRSANQYCVVFEPLLILEAKAQFVRSFQELRLQTSFRMVLEGVAMTDSRTEISFTMSNQDYQVETWNENSILHLKNENNRELMIRIVEIKRKGDNVLLVCHCSLGGSRSQLSPEIRPTSVWDARLLMKMSTLVREYESLTYFLKMPLRNEILLPPQGLTCYSHDGKTEKYIEKLGMNPPQARAISYALSKQTGFVLIQGPPGTGKTKTILGLVAAIQNTGTTISVPSNFGGEKQKYKKSPLLICAPSNAAIDEIARRLMTGILNLNGNRFKPSILRIGNHSSIHSDVIPVSLNYLVDKKLESSYSGFADEKQALREELNLAHEALNRLRASKGTIPHDEYSAAMATLMKKMDSLNHTKDMQRKDPNYSRDRMRIKIVKELIDSADIILTTLSGAGHDVFRQIDIEFPTVIIDEACQAVELNVLIPLRLGCKRCILVGDPQQLPPTVLSPIALKNKYDGSLFQRLMKASPKSVSLLSIQYRMHPHISLFPGKRFYSSRLTDFELMDSLRTIDWHRHPNNYFPPYVFFDCHRGTEKRSLSKSIYNEEEIQVCVRLIRNLAETYPKTKVISFHLVWPPNRCDYVLQRSSLSPEEQIKEGIRQGNCELRRREYGGWVSRPRKRHYHSKLCKSFKGQWYWVFAR